MADGELTFNHVAVLCKAGSGICPDTSSISSVSTASHFSVSLLSHESRASISSMSKAAYPVSNTIDSLERCWASDVFACSFFCFQATHTPSPLNKTPIIVGGTVGGLAVVGLMVLLGVFFVRRQRERELERLTETNSIYRQRR